MKGVPQFLRDLPRLIPFSAFRFSLRADGDVLLPAYKGSTFRGAFGAAFRRFVCVTKLETCSPCLLKERCAYSYLFETPVPVDAGRLRKYPFAPHPFVLVPPVEDRRVYRDGDSFSFLLTLVGRAQDYLPYVIYVFDEIGRRGIGRRRGRYHLEGVEWLDGEGGTLPIYDNVQKILLNAYGSTAVHFSDLHSKQITLHFMTPVRVRSERHLANCLSFGVLVRNLLRRLSSLAYFHCGHELDLDYQELVKLADTVQTVEDQTRWMDWERYSARQEAKIKMGGVVGEIVFEGEGIAEFLPVLALGEHLHVGKGTAFGLGRYGIKWSVKREVPLL